MNTLEIEKICQKQDPFISRYFFLGCVACDELPTVFPENCLVIVNSEKHTSEGLHWMVCGSLDKDRSLFIDSFGQKITNKYILQSLENRKKPIVCNGIPLQHHFSQYCAYFCIFFCYFLSRNYSLEEILQTFFSHPRSTIYCDLLVKNFITTVFQFKRHIPFTTAELIERSMASGKKFLAWMEKSKKKGKRKKGQRGSGKKRQKGMGRKRRRKRGRKKGVCKF